MIMPILRLLHFSSSFMFAESSEEGKSAKKERAPASEHFTVDPEQSLDERNGLLNEHESDLPPGFLSPSVREYLELGKSIPGKRFSIVSGQLV